MSTDHATNIAIIGASGRCGQHVTDALLATGKHKVTIITRPDSKATFPSAVHEIKKIDYSSVSDLSTALRGQHVLIIFMAVGVDVSVLERMIDAAIAAGVRFVFPNEWGGDISDTDVAKDTFLYDRFMGVRKYVENNGQDRTVWIGVACGFWYEFSLAGTEARYGFDFEQKKVTFYNDGNLSLNTTTWPQVGRAVAALLSLEMDRQDGADVNKPVISDWANSALSVSSFVVSQRDMLDSVVRVTGAHEKDWAIEYENVVERYQRGVSMMQKGQMVGFGIQLYARNFYPRKQGSPKRAFDNKKLGLPTEDFDQATMVAVAMAVRGETNAIH